MRRKVSILLFLAALVGLAFLFRPRPVPPPRVLRPTAHQVALAERHMEGLRGQFLTPAGAGPRTLRVSEGDLNVFLAGNRAARTLLVSHGVRAVQITLQEPAGLSLRASVLFQGRPRNVQLDGTLAPDPNVGLRFTATHAQVGRFPLPASALTGQANAVAAHFSRLMAGRMPLTIQSVRVRGHELDLTGLPVIRRAAAIPR